MMRWNVIHKIKSLHDDGKGLSIRAISRELGISRNSVRKYLRQDETTTARKLDNPVRSKQLDTYRGYLISLLASFPGLSAVKIARKLKEKLGELPTSERSIRRYVSALKEEVATGQHRYYEPVVDEVPGVQCQVDPGELRNVLIGGVETVVHFVVFVLAYSRLMYVGLSFKPLDTRQFIQLHDEALRYFGGMPEELVYDQTKLVVIEEKYRELTLNERFHQYATTAGFRIHACEGYDPESKGKVEAGVKYVKQDCFYGESFRDEQHLREHVCHWLNTVANIRLHGTTGEAPQLRFERDEKALLKPYLSPSCVTSEARETRKADKTGLISWKANKYSVPMAWQQSRVGVLEDDSQLHVIDLQTGEVIAQHALAGGKGQIIKNTHHYRDHAQRRQQLEQDIQVLVGDEALSLALCDQLRRSLPKVYKDQLFAVRNLLSKHAPVERDMLLNLSQKPGLTARQIEAYLVATQLASRRERLPEPVPEAPSELDLSAYRQLGRSTGQEVTHGHA